MLQELKFIITTLSESNYCMKFQRSHFKHLNNYEHILPDTPVKEQNKCLFCGKETVICSFGMV